MKSIRVLYVEDDLFDADLTLRQLKRHAPHIILEIAHTYAEALRSLENGGNYDLILADLHLPDGSGFALLSHVRQRRLPLAVVVTTGQGDEEIAVSALKAGADDYVVKGDDYLTHLHLTLESALERYRAETARKSRPLRILYLNQNPADVNLTVQYFKSHTQHIHVEAVGHESELFQKTPILNRGEYDVLLMDFRLPDLDVLGILKELRQVRKIDLPIVLVTDQGDEEIAAQVLRLGVSDYLVKNPGYLSQLPGILENAYHRAQLQHEQAALRESEERYRRLAENALDIIFRYRLSPMFAIDYVNPAVTRTCGYTQDEFYQQPDLGLKIIHPEDRATMEALLLERPPKNTDLVLRWVCKNGEIIWLELRFAPVYDESRNLVALEGIARDITERKQAEEQIQRQIQRLNALHTIDMAITASLDLRVTLSILMEHVIANLGSHAAATLLLNAHTKMLEYGAGRGFSTRIGEKFRIRLGQGLVGKAILVHDPIRIPHLAEYNQPDELITLMTEEGFASCSGLPLIVKGQTKGMLLVFHREPHQPDPEWLTFFEMMANQAAIAIDSTELFENLQRANLELSLAYDTTLEGWVRALDLRDKETEGHTQRVAEITAQLARAMGVDDTSLSQIRRGALLHDIGKMGVADSILHKPGPLNAEEWEVMRKHPVYAFELLSPITYLRQSLDIPYCHHEKWDGSGYPQGLKAEQIPLAARIFAIVDVWDALRSDRPYRPAWESSRVTEYINEQSGKHFDPAVVSVFMQLIEHS